MYIFPKQTTPTILGALLIFSNVLQASAQNQCPPLGPVLPAPQNPSTNANVRAAVKGISAVAQELTSSFNTTAVSIGVMSTFEEAPMLSFHHTPEFLNTTGTHNVTIDTVYRIASISKAYTVLALLQLSDKINMADPVTKYVPELAQLDKQQSQINDITTVRWGMVTIDALASHLAGISAELGNMDLANQPGPYTSLGFPSVQPADSSMCGGSPTQRSCTRADFFKKFGTKHPVYAPYTTPVYSNPAFAILGFVIEAVTNESYADYMERAVFKPLGLTQTTVGKPANDSVGIIPSESNWWSTSDGFENSSGGLYASTRDLLAFGRAILTYRALSPLATRAWLKPKTFTSSLGVSVGAPWEIGRSDNVTSDGRVVDFYSKAGNLDDYNSILILIPDYDIVMSIAIAGPAGGQDVIYGIATQIIWNLLPAIEAAGKAEAKAAYAGTYEAGSSTNVTASIILAVDDGPGLHVTNYTSHGHDLIAEYAVLTNNPSPPEVRMYPTNLQSSNATSQQVAWRAVYNEIPDSVDADKQLFFLQGSCQSWSVIDLLSYGLTALDDFVFTVGKEGKVARSVDARALRTTMMRVE